MAFKIEDKNEYLNCECPICGKKFHLKPYRIKRCKINYCSKKCFYEHKKIRCKGAGNHQYGLKGDKNKSWKGGRRVTSCGYIMVYDESHPFRDKRGYVFEHRIVAEKYLLNKKNSVIINGKRYLAHGYVVHHVNFDRMDNRVENLRVMESNDHRRLHSMLNQNERDSRTGRFKKREIIKVKRVTDTAIMPERKSIGAAGYDLFADVDHVVEIKPHKTVVLYSGIALSMPKNYFGAIYARSGISTKRGLRPSTCVSVIDSDFRGNIGLPIHNDTDEIRYVQPHERVAQLVITEIPDTEMEEVDALDKTERGSDGFGSTGK